MARSTHGRTGRDDGGAALVEFALISVLLVFLLFGVLQVAVYFYARVIVSSSAADAARYAATAGIPPGAGAERAERLIAQSLGGGRATRIRCTSRIGTDAASGYAVTTVHCTGRVRAMLVPLDIPLRLDLTSSALREGEP